MDIEGITKDDADFFMDMVKSSKGPNTKSGFYHQKPYYKILDNPHSAEYQRFMKVYNKTKYILKERERHILDDIYGVNKPRATLNEASKPHGITSQRISQILHSSERRMVSSLIRSFNRRKS